MSFFNELDMKGHLTKLKKKSSQDDKHLPSQASQASLLQQQKECVFFYSKLQGSNPYLPHLNPVNLLTGLTVLAECTGFFEIYYLILEWGSVDLHKARKGMCLIPFR